MRISSVTIRNYRSLKDVTIDLDEYGVFIGANGSGKSSILYALDWFFNGTPLALTDIHRYEPGQALDSSTTIEVSVTFADLTAKDKDRLEQYGRVRNPQIRRTWYAESNQTKTVGNSRQGPGFAAVRSDQAIAARRTSYNSLQSTLTGLPAFSGNFSKEQILDALATWESDPTNEHLLEEVPDSDATSMLGWNGPNVIRQCLQFVLIPAAISIAGEIGTAAKGTALTELVGAFMSSASAKAQATWLQANAQAVADLSRQIRESIETATGVQATRVNARLASLIPNASVSLTPSVPDFSPTINPTITTTVTIDDITNDVARQGHGVQRAVMISMFQAIVPDEEITRTTHIPEEGEEEEASRARLEDAIGGLPSIVVAIEEPEIYQHPIRARSFARTLIDLSRQAGTQIVLATHSPYFIQPEKFAALHRFTSRGGETLVANATVQSVAEISGIDEDKVAKSISSHVPTEFSEGFFADGVALVEGSTDRVVVEAVATKLGNDLDHNGITVLSVEGKGGLRVARAILTSLGIPTYVLADGDHGTSDYKTYKNDAAKTQAHASHRVDTERLVAALPKASTVKQGSLPYTFGDQSVVCADFTIWKDDIEGELAAWGSFVSALAAEGIDISARSNKNLLAYRNGVYAAGDDDIPDILKSVVEAVVGISRSTGGSSQTAEAV